MRLRFGECPCPQVHATPSGRCSDWPTERTLVSMLGDPGVVVWPSGFLEAWGYQGQQTTHVQEQSGLLALPPSEQSQKTIRFWKMCGLLALVPKAGHRRCKICRVGPQPSCAQNDFQFCSWPPPSPGGGSGLQRSLGNRTLWADSGPDPGGM